MVVVSVGREVDVEGALKAFRNKIRGRVLLALAFIRVELANPHTTKEGIRGVRTMVVETLTILT